MQIIKTIKNELFKRQEIEAVLEAEKNPSFVEMKKLISEQLKKPEENIKVYNIKGEFGSKKFKISAYVYDSKEDLEKAVQKTQKQRKAEAEKAKADAEATEKPAEDIETGNVVEDKSKEDSEEGDKSEDTNEEKKPAEIPVEEKPEQETKADKESEQGKEESKEQ